MVAWGCALGLLFALSCWLVSEIPSNTQFLDSIWFAFIASTTIGLGDIVPPARELHLVLVHFFFLLIGVTLVGLLVSAAVRSSSLHYKIEARIRLNDTADRVNGKNVSTRVVPDSSSSSSHDEHTSGSSTADDVQPFNPTLDLG